MGGRTSSRSRARSKMSSSLPSMPCSCAGRHAGGGSQGWLTGGRPRSPAACGSGHRARSSIHAGRAQQAGEQAGNLRVGRQLESRQAGRSASKATGRVGRQAGEQAGRHVGRHAGWRAGGQANQAGPLATHQAARKVEARRAARRRGGQQGAHSGKARVDRDVWLCCCSSQVCQQLLQRVAGPAARLGAAACRGAAGPGLGAAACWGAASRAAVTDRGPASSSFHPRRGRRVAAAGPGRCSCGGGCRGRGCYGDRGGGGWGQVEGGVEAGDRGAQGLRCRRCSCRPGLRCLLCGLGGRGGRPEGIRCGRRGCRPGLCCPLLYCRPGLCCLLPCWL